MDLYNPFPKLPEPLLHGNFRKEPEVSDIKAVAECGAVQCVQKFHYSFRGIVEYIFHCKSCPHLSCPPDNGGPYFKGVVKPHLDVSVKAPLVITSVYYYCLWPGYFSQLHDLVHPFKNNSPYL